MNQTLLDWLSEDNNPGVRLRALTGLRNLASDHPEVVAARAQVLQTLEQARDLSWMSGKGLALLYNLVAVAESGLVRGDLPVDPLVDRFLAAPFDANCADLLLLRTLVMLGYGEDPRVRARLAEVSQTQLPDGGWLCLHRTTKMKRIPKSCIKANMHALLLSGEMKKRGFHFPVQGEEGTLERLVRYFLDRRVFYRMDDPTRLVLDCRPGWRMTDVFFPAELMRVGLPMLMEAFSATGAGDAPELKEAWDLLKTKRDPQERLILEGTLVKPYLPREKVGKPAKWPTLYACLAERVD